MYEIVFCASCTEHLLSHPIAQIWNLTIEGERIYNGYVHVYPIFPTLDQDPFDCAVCGKSFFYRLKFRGTAFNVYARLERV